MKVLEQALKFLFVLESGSMDTRAQRKLTTSNMSGRPRVDVNNSLATMLWNISVTALGKVGDFSSISN
jgi:hypothetical protein